MKHYQSYFQCVGYLQMVAIPFRAHLMIYQKRKRLAPISSFRNTVQGTFDDLSEEEKTRAYLQFLQYHQQLEQENETKKFQQMLNQDQNSSQDLKPVTGGTEKNGAGENNENDSINGWTGGANSSEKKLHANNTILILMYTIIAAIVFHF